MRRGAQPGLQEEKAEGTGTCVRSWAQKITWPKQGGTSESLVGYQKWWQMVLGGAHQTDYSNVTAVQATLDWLSFTYFVYQTLELEATESVSRITRQGAWRWEELVCWQHMGGRREDRTFQANLCGKKVKPWLKKGEERRKRREEEKSVYTQT